MGEITLLALAFGLGLLGFIEPCSIGANGIFLGYLRQKDRRVKLFETVKFVLVRSAVLGLLKRLSPERLLSGHKDYSSRLGLLFGLNLPACALMLALLGRSIASGASWGFAALFVFGLALSAPPVPLALSRRADKLFECLGLLGGATPYVVGAVLIALAAYVLFTATPYFDLSG